MPLSRLKLAWSLALLALPLGAQSDEEPAGSWPNSLPVAIDHTAVRQTPAFTISADLLRYPLSDKALHMLQKAVRTSEAGDHAGAVRQLQKTLAKWASSGAYVNSLIGVEFLKTGQIAEAVDALEHAVTLLPHDASNHANLGLALVCKGQYDRAEPELQRALDLDPHNTVASQLLKALAQRESTEVQRESRVARLPPQ